MSRNTKENTLIVPDLILDQPNPTPDLEVATEYAIEFNNVSRRYRLHHEPKLTLQDRVVNIFNRKSTYEEFWALKDVSFKLEKGKTLGVIGQNGAGKSTLLKLATRILEPTGGNIRVNGRVSAMLELGTGFHPELSARENIYLNGAFYGFNRKQMDERYDEIVEFSELGKFIDTPIKHFSSGMYMRLGFAVAITVSPDILIIDEVLAVGDAAFGRKCHQAIEDLKSQSKAMLFVSHSAGEISRFCDEVIYLNKGRLVAQGKPGDVLDEYMMDSMGPSYFASKPKPTAAKPTTPVASTSKSEPLNAPSPVKATRSEPTIKLDWLDSVFTPDLSRYCKPSYGLCYPHNSWEFSMPFAMQPDNYANMQQVVDEAETEYYLAILNPLVEKQTLEVTGYKQVGGQFDRLAGALRQFSMGRHEIEAEHTMMLRLNSSALRNLTQLRVTSDDQLLWVELVEYQPTPKVAGSSALMGVIPALFWVFPFCDIRGNNISRFEVFNPHDEPITVNLTLYRDWQGALYNIRTYRCSPHSQLMIDLNEELAGGEGERNHGERFYGGVALSSEHAIIAKRYNLQLSVPGNYAEQGAKVR